VNRRGNKLRLVIISSLISLTALGLALIIKPRPKVVKVVDGDTINLSNGQTIRYIGVDTPEKGECFYEEATKINQDLVLNQEVEIKTDANNLDRFGRVLAYVWVGDIFVNQELLSLGAGEYFMDTVNLAHQTELVEAAEQGYQAKSGLWSVCAPGPEGCVIKGNISRLDIRWYHLPEFRHYGQTVINLDQGDRWFCTEEDAIKAGFQRARE